MRRDYFELTVEHVGWVEAGGDPNQPTVRIDFHGPEGLLENRLTGPGDDLLSAAETDVSYRFRDESPGEESASGVVAVTNRVTGEFVLELNEEADDVLRFVRAAREYGQSTDDDGGRYSVVIRIDGETLATYSKSTFLVYDANGSLLRSKSLIPSGVEL